MSPIIPSRYGHPKYNSFPQKSRATSLGGLKGVSQRGVPGSDSKSRRKQRLEENKITIQTTEDEDTDNFYNKHLAAARFQRNHRLINVLFSDVVVDQNQDADNEKLAACRQKRIKSLEEYRDKISKEMVELEDKFNAKRAKIIEDGETFNKNLNEFIEKSKKEVVQLRASQDVRRQKESVIRQQVAKQNQIAANNRSATPAANATSATTNSTTTTTSSHSDTNLSISRNGIVPMEVDEKQTTKDDIQLVLDSLVAKIV